MQKFQNVNPIILFSLYFYGFPFYKNNFINGNVFVFVRENICRPLRKLRPDTGKSLAIFLNHWLNDSFLVFFFIDLLFISKIMSNVRYLFMWGKRYFFHSDRYDPKQGNPLQNFKITNQNVSAVLLLFRCFYQGHQQRRIFQSIQLN